MAADGSITHEELKLRLAIRTVGPMAIRGESRSVIRLSNLDSRQAELSQPGRQILVVRQMDELAVSEAHHLADP